MPGEVIDKLLWESDRALGGESANGSYRTRFINLGHVRVNLNLAIFSTEELVSI